MRGLAGLAVGAAVSAGACTTTDKYSGLDGPPGGYVVGSSQFQRTMADLNPFQSQYTTQWTLVRVVAPPGATQCRIADQSLLIPEVSDRAFGFACKPGMLEKLKAEDIGAASG